MGPNISWSCIWIFHAIVHIEGSIIKEGHDRVRQHLITQLVWYREYGNTGCGGDTKLERFLPKDQHTQRKLLNVEFWINGELSKIGHYFSNKVI